MADRARADATMPLRNPQSRWLKVRSSDGRVYYKKLAQIFGLPPDNQPQWSLAAPAEGVAGECAGECAGGRDAFPGERVHQGGQDGLGRVQLAVGLAQVHLPG